MSETLYRKYRPKAFSEVTDQEPIKLTIAQEIKSGKLAHAFLFSGPRGVGKTTMARLLAKAVNCPHLKDGFEPCNECEVCKEIESGRSLDVIEIDAASQTGVDQVRENIIASARMATAIRKCKVFIVDEVHMLSTAAFNALLKTLEEPPANVYFILATTEIHKVPATIISRCQRFDFKKIRTPAMIERLRTICQSEGILVSDDVLAAVAKNSQGYLRDAISLMGQILGLGQKKITSKEAELIMPRTNLDKVWQVTQAAVQKDLAKGLQMISSLADDGADMSQFSAEWIEFLRNVMLAKVSANWQDLSNFSSQEISDAVKNEVGWQLPDMARLISLILAHRTMIKTSEIASLPLELALVSYCHNPADGLK